MNKLPISIALLVLLSLGFAASLAWSAAALPMQVATHFNAAGDPDGWMNRSSHLVAMSLFGFGFPLLFIAVFRSIRWLPSCVVNIPRREYWLAPERRAESERFLLHHSVWLACTASAFVTGLNLLIVASNQSQPPHLPTAWVLMLAGTFLAFVGGWIFQLHRRFAFVGS